MIQTAFADPSATSSEWLDEFDNALLRVTLPPVELLSLHAVAAFEHAPLVGLDAFPISFPEPGQATRALYNQLVFAAEIDATLFDVHLNGLAHALIGRLLAWDQGDIQAAARPLHEAQESSTRRRLYRRSSRASTRDQGNHPPVWRLTERPPAGSLRRRQNWNICAQMWRCTTQASVANIRRSASPDWTTQSRCVVSPCSCP